MNTKNFQPKYLDPTKLKLRKNVNNSNNLSNAKNISQVEQKSTRVYSYGKPSGFVKRNFTTSKEKFPKIMNVSERKDYLKTEESQVEPVPAKTKQTTPTANLKVVIPTTRNTEKIKSTNTANYVKLIRSQSKTNRSEGLNSSKTEMNAKCNSNERKVSQVQKNITRIPLYSNSQKGGVSLQKSGSFYRNSSSTSSIKKKSTEDTVKDSIKMKPMHTSIGFSNVISTNSQTNSSISTLKGPQNNRKIFQVGDVEGPEDMHFLYVNMNQHNKILAEKFEI